MQHKELLWQICIKASLNAGLLPLVRSVFEDGDANNLGRAVLPRRIFDVHRKPVDARSSSV
jgi:hypothetical protein